MPGNNKETEIKPGNNEETEIKHPVEGRMIYRINDIITLTGTNRQQIYRWEQEEDFPKAIMLSERTKGWWKTEFIDWLKSRRAA